MWSVVNTIGWLLVSASALSIMWFAPGPGFILFSGKVPWQAAVAFGYMIGIFSLGLVSFGVLCLAFLIRRILSADWRFTRRFEETMLPLELNRRRAFLAIHCAFVAFALCHIAAQ